MSPDLTPAQNRLLRYCATRSGWIPLQELEANTRYLHPDDVVTVPSLIERGLLAHRLTPQSIRATPKGILTFWRDP